MLLWLSPAPEIFLGNLRHKFLATLVDSQVVWLQPVENLISTIRFIASQKVPKGNGQLSGTHFPLRLDKKKADTSDNAEKVYLSFQNER